MSKFNLTDLADALAGQSTETGNPTCNKCREDEHNRCPTAIENHGRSGWTSNFPECACYTSDVSLHAGLVEADDEEFAENREGHFGRADWDPEGRQAWDSVDGQLPGW